MLLKQSLEKKLENTINKLAASNSDGDLLRNSSYILKVAEKRKKENHDKRLNFARGYKRFGDEHVNPQAKEAKNYINQLRDPDILELLPNKRWNISTKKDDKAGTQELCKTLFEVRNGLSDVNIVKLKPKKVEMGCDSRDIYYVGWDNSTYLTNQEKSKMNIEGLEKAFRNTENAWYNISERNKILGGTGSTFYSKGKEKFNNTGNNFNMTGFTNFTQHPQKFEYKSPDRTIEERNNILRKIKLNNQETKEKLKNKVQYEFPAASKEKISAIVYRRMNSTFNSELWKNMSKPWRKHKGLFNTQQQNSFRNTQNTFKTTHSNKNMLATTHTNFSSTLNNQVHQNNNKNKDKEDLGFEENENLLNNNNFNVTGFSNYPFNKTQGGSSKGFFASNFTTGISFFNKTKHSNFSIDSKKTHDGFLPLPSKKKEFYPKEKWIQEIKTHPGKFVSFILHYLFINIYYFYNIIFLLLFFLIFIISL